MKKTSIILTNSPSETRWAINYIKTHPQLNVVILSANIESQILMRKNRLPHLSLYKVEKFDMNKVTSENPKKENNIFFKSFALIKKLEDDSKNIGLEIFGHNIIKLISNNLAFIYPDIFHCHKTYQNIVKKWHPTSIYVSGNTKEEYISGNRDAVNSLACFIKYYIKEGNIKVISYVTKEKISTRFPPLDQLYRYLNLIITKYLLVLRNSFKGKNIKPINKTSILMETGGIISSYYMKLYERLEIIYSFTLILYKLGLAQQVSLLQNNVRFKYFDSFWDISQNKELEKKYSNLKKVIDRLNTKFNYIKDVNLQFALLCQTKLFIRKSLNQIIKRMIIQKKILSITKPKLVINSHDPSIFGSSLVLQAINLKIPTLLLLHGMYIEDFILEHHSNYLAVWGGQTKRYFIEHSQRDPKTIFSSGFPKFDNLDVDTSIRKKSTFRKLKVGLFLNSYFPSDSYQSKFFWELFSALKKVKIKLIINYRFHEGFNTNGLDLLAGEFKLKSNNHSYWELNKFIKNNDVIISWDTTAILWAMFFQKPLIHTSPIWDSAAMTPTQEYQAAWRPKNAHDLVHIIENFINNPEIYQELALGQQKFLKDVAGKIDGKANVRLTEYVSRLLK